ncbi:MAG: HAMP domain-containing histidine kinase [Defluviitaleaceae bacterium]|nr:HAMP domain-containing histidine kinase [Defluviitaleaceae bacterium]
MMALWIICGLLAVLLVVAIVRLLRLKADIRQLSNRLEEITKTDTNAQLTTHTFDKNMTKLAKSANKLLAKSRRDYVSAQQLEADLKRAIANISHDLRTPLTSAKGYLQMLEGQEKPAETRYLNIIKGRLETLAALMDSLFAFSSALDGELSIKKTNIGNTLRDTLSASYAELESKGFTVESHIPDTPVYCLCDEDALKRILQNLIKNAYTHGKEYIQVNLSGSTIEITNKAGDLQNIDTNRIFDRFYTADAARTYKRTGLGLAIARELVQKMGGSISAAQNKDLLTVKVYLKNH